jgi:hypothetical protein
MRSWTRNLATAATVGVIAVTASACTPDTTRARVEADVPSTFAKAYAVSEQLQGHGVVRPQVTKTECHSSVNTLQDSGPGSWDCELAYTVNGKPKKASLLILIDSLACYQALDGENRDDTIKDRATGATLPDPKVGFDGCFSVYDDKTDTSKT